ncbi:MAG: GntR family transcriptional regulator [Bacteroidales bacterium]|nr:GntR family transcriptional regulator [Bacteroidales bacterium]
MIFRLAAKDKAPIYKQLVTQVERAIHEGKLQADEMLPSMNDLASSLGISRETVKKAYNILTDRGMIRPRQGKGFYVADVTSDTRPQVLVIIDKFSIYKQALLNAFTGHLGDAAEITLLNHNQSIDLLEYYLDCNLDAFEYYVVMPHFPLDAATQAKVSKQLARIPNRKLIMLDRLQPSFPGNYGAVYQDFENDIYKGLCDGLASGATIDNLRVITLPTSLYGKYIRKGVKLFSSEKHIPVEFFECAPDDIRKGDTFLVLNSQLDAGLVDLARKIHDAGLQTGRDVRIISYNEHEMNELILGGLTTVSTDFCAMGRLAADMILYKNPEKIHCPFRITRRSTF